MKTKRVYLDTAVFIFALAIIGIGGEIAINRANISADTASLSESPLPADMGCIGGSPDDICSLTEDLTSCPSDCAMLSEF